MLSVMSLDVEWLWKTLKGLQKKQESVQKSGVIHKNITE